MPFPWERRTIGRAGCGPVSEKVWSMQLMNREAFLVAYLLCESLVRGPEYIDAMTDPQTYQNAGEDLEAPDRKND